MTVRIPSVGSPQPILVMLPLNEWNHSLLVDFSYHVKWNHVSHGVLEKQIEMLTVFDLIWGPHFLLDWAHVLLWKIIQPHQSLLMSQYFEEIIEWGPLLPKKKNVLLSRAQQGEKDANDSGMPRGRAATPTSKRAEAHLTASKNTTSEIARLSSNFAITTK